MSESAAEEILRYERDVNEALRRLRKRTHWEAATVDTPFDSVLANDDGMLDEWAVRTETVRRLFDYFLGDGPHPAQILRRLFAIGRHMRIEPFCLMNLREMALMLGDSHGAQHWRMKKICVDPLLRRGDHSVKAPGQKGLAASAAAAKAQRGNTNRAKSTKHNHHENQKKSKTRRGKAHAGADGNGGLNGHGINRKEHREHKRGVNGSGAGRAPGRNDNVVVGGRDGRGRGKLGLINSFAETVFPGATAVAGDDVDPAGPACAVAHESADTL